MSTGKQSGTPIYLSVNPLKGQADETRSMVTSLWLSAVIGLPLLIVAWRTGWSDVFRSGEAAGFMAGALVAASAENVFQQFDDRFGPFKEALRAIQVTTEEGILRLMNGVFQSRNQAILAVKSLCITVAFLSWNIEIMISDRHAANAKIDWVPAGRLLSCTRIPTTCTLHDDEIRYPGI